MKSNAMDKASLYYIVGRAICRNEFLECIQALGSELEAILPDNEPNDVPEEDEDEDNDGEDESSQDDSGLSDPQEENEENTSTDEAFKTSKNKISDDIITNILSTVVADKQYSWKELAEIAQVPKSTLHRLFSDCRRDTVYVDGTSLVKFRGSDIIEFIREK